jgi:hypothetical protein
MTDGRNKPYEKPEVRELGSIEELTLANKKFGPTDGNFFNGSAIQNT